MSKYDWDNMKSKLQKDALTDGNKKVYEVDERFYRLARDENDNGGALIRFVPDSEDMMFIKMTKINARQNDGSKRFVAEWSPQSIGQKDPFNEKFLKLWGEGHQEEAKKYSRAFRFLANIVVEKDPANPTNNGKTFLLDMSPTLFAKLKEAMTPTASEIALGAEPKAVFNPLNGNSFLLKVGKAATGFLSYETSKFNDAETALYKTEAQADKAILENTHKLNEFLKPESFMSYDELTEKLAWFDGESKTITAEEVTEAEKAFGTDQPGQPDQADEKAKTEQKVLDDDLDDLLNDM